MVKYDDLYAASQPGQVQLITTSRLSIETFASFNLLSQLGQYSTASNVTCINTSFFPFMLLVLRVFVSVIIRAGHVLDGAADAEAGE